MLENKWKIKKRWEQSSCFFLSFIHPLDISVEADDELLERMISILLPFLLPFCLGFPFLDFSSFFCFVFLLLRCLLSWFPFHRIEYMDPSIRVLFDLLCLLRFLSLFQILCFRFSVSHSQANLIPSDERKCMKGVSLALWVYVEKPRCLSIIIIISSFFSLKEMRRLREENCFHCNFLFLSWNRI